MDDPLLVRRFECLGDLPRNGQRFIERDRVPRDPLREIVAFDEFHHEGVCATRLLEPVNRGDVGMVQ